MDESDFEGTLVLETMAELFLLDEFMGAIDSDDFQHVKSLMKKAKIDEETRAVVLKKMVSGDGEH